MKRIAFIVVILLAIVSTSIFSTLSPFTTTIYAIAEGEKEAEEAVENEEAEETFEVTFPSTINESTLAEDYILSVMPHKSDGVLRASRPSGLSLTGSSRKLYRLLAIYIDAVADGEESNTEFTFEPADVYEKTVYTAEDLNVDYIKDENGFNPEAVAAMQAIRSQLSFQDVAACLMSDFPLQMYWFGKGYVPSNCTISGTEDYLRFTGNVVFKMRVAEDYATTTVAVDGTVSYSAYEIDTRYGQAIQNAAANAAEVLNEYAGLSDYEMLRGYRDVIRSLTSYNTPAAQGEYTFSYGNPWQLVWVFDGDPDTTVVCEGYSKAFQYLVEQGGATAEAISVQGYLNEISANRAHMWNIVSMDGHNYLVDVTNDYEYRLFLVGADGNVDGYSAGGLRYYYNRTYTYRTDEELTIEPYSYSEWREATSSAPDVHLGSDRTYPGYQVAVKVESSNGMLPVDQIVIHSNNTEETLIPTDGIALLSLAEDTEISIAAVVDGITTPATEAMSITVAEEPETVFSLPAGSRVEAEAFSGIAAELVQVNGNDVAPGAFDEGVVLAVGEIGDWFESGYRFVVTVSAGEMKNSDNKRRHTSLN